MGASIKGSPEYISHGEVQWGLSLDGLSWVGDLSQRLASDLRQAADDPGVAVAAAYDAAGAPLGAAFVRWTSGPGPTFATLDDLVVRSDARSRGVGADLLAHVEREARSRGARWLFLESGLRNERAHDFFDRHGFKAMSKVFAKPL